MADPIVVQVNTWKIIFSERKRGDVIKACPHCGVIALWPVRRQRCGKCDEPLVRVLPVPASDGG